MARVTTRAVPPSAGGLTTVLLEHSFTVPVPVSQAWEVLLDIERIAPCMPGAALTSFEGDDFAGTVKVKLGPVSLTFKGKGRFVERDETAHRVVLTASGADSRGGGTAAAKVTASLHDAGDAGTKVEVATDLDVTGKAAQFGRGLIGDVSAKLIGQFADCLAGKLAAGGPPSAETAEGGPGALPGQGTATGAPGDTGAVSAPASAAEGVAPGTAAEAVAPGTAAEAVAPGTAAGARSAPTALSESSVSVDPGDGVEPIDLLAVSGIGAVVRRAVPYVVTAAASFAVVFGVIWWIKRR
ncbi:SRPBCC domain-containing protein [Dactylosporangium sp. NBC_01737]|uniref:SRPBCC domain-containing protein n=1 Tax=Dactylosporangium sp. NBC_01737 TaxID=2975959 RepID=UPI002E0DE8E0|nr:SRPBCC domain-containing protein [Dactylosporangium sp. NBC_01737]